MERRTGQTETNLTGETECLAYGLLGYGIVTDFALTGFCERVRKIPVEWTQVGKTSHSSRVTRVGS